MKINEIEEVIVRYIDKDCGPRGPQVIKEYAFNSDITPQLLISSFKSTNYITFDGQRYSCSGHVETEITETVNEFSGNSLNIVHEIAMYKR